MSHASNRAGFTLIELIISVAIVGVLSTIVFGNFVTENRVASVRQGANQIALDLQKMYSYALSGRLQSTERPDWYGVAMNPAAGTSYSLVYHLAGHIASDIPTLRARFLPAKTRIQSITDGSGNSKAVLTVKYALPGGGMSYLQWPTDTVLIITVASTVTASVTSCVQITRNVSAVNVGPCS